MISKYITKNILFEIGFVVIDKGNIGITFDMNYRYNCDTKGFFFMLYICRVGFEFNIYGVKHAIEDSACHL